MFPVAIYWFHIALSCVTDIAVLPRIRQQTVRLLCCAEATVLQKSRALRLYSELIEENFIALRFVSLLSEARCVLGNVYILAAIDAM